MGSLEEALGRDAADLLFDAVIVLDPDGRVQRRIPSSGLPEERVDAVEAGQQILERLHPDDLPKIVASLAEAASSPGRPIRIDGRVRPVDDNTRWRPFTAIGAGVDAGELQGHVVIGIVADALLEHSLLDPDDAAYSLAGAAPVGLAMVSADDDLLWVNGAFRSLLGRPSDQAVGDWPERELEPIRRLARASRDDGPVTELLGVDGTQLRLGAALLHPDRGGEVIVSAQDVTAEIEAVRRRVTAEGDFAAAFDHSQAGIAIIGGDGHFERINPAYSSITGYLPEELAGQHASAIVHPADDADDSEYIGQLRAGSRTSYRVERRYVHAAGGDVWVDQRVAIVRGDGGPDHFVATITDISEHKAIEDEFRAQNAELTYQATHDHLTGLPNRALLQEHLAVAVAQAGRTGTKTCVLMCDLDKFKAVNDTFGHAAGDAVLVELATRLRDTCREGDVVARVGGDEFVIVASTMSFPAMALRLAERLVAAVRRPITLGDEVAHLGVSIGIATARLGETTGEVLRRADEMAYHVKQTGGGFALDPGDLRRPSA